MIDTGFDYYLSLPQAIGEQKIFFKIRIYVWQCLSPKK